tara:strand:+ start:412 stop:582 length:171 start_codon:yes stop_codon:yes gene_type:complete
MIMLNTADYFEVLRTEVIIEANIEGPVAVPISLVEIDQAVSGVRQWNISAVEFESF